MNKFEIVSRCADWGLVLPKRSTSGAAGYDFEVVENTIIPSYQHLLKEMERNKWEFMRDKTSAYDMFKPLNLEEISNITKQLKAKPTLVPTGIKCKLDEGFYLELSVRSSLPLKHWLILANSNGIIDGDYYNNESNEGEIFFQLINLSPFDIELRKGDRIGQGIIKPYYLVEGDSYRTGAKRTGGFGSTSGYIAVNAPYIIGSDENICAEPNYTTTTNVETETPYFTITDTNDGYCQLSFNDII